MIESRAKTFLRDIFRGLGLSDTVLYWGSFLVDWKKISRELAIERDYRQLKKQVGSFMQNKDLLKNALKKVLFVSLSDEAYQFKAEMILAKSLQLKGFEPYIVVSKSQQHSPKYFRVMGISKILKIEDFLDAKKTQQLQKSHDFESINPPYTFSKLLNFKVKGILLGQHLLSTYLANYQNSHQLLESREFEEYCKAKTQKILSLIPAAENIMDIVKPDMVVFLEKGYIPQALFFDLALQRNLNVIQWCGAQETDAYVLKKFVTSNRKMHPFSLSPESWEKVVAMPWSPEMDQRFMKLIRDRYENDSWYNRNLLRAKVSMRTPSEIKKMLVLDPKKKTAIIFSHILWDATFFYGENLFEDYEKWLMETVKVACANDSLNWVIKLHPDYVWKLKRSGGVLHEPDIFTELFGRLPDHVKLMLPDTDINTYSLFEVADYCITVRGTIGIEMACFGIPVFTAGTGRYSGLGFTIDSTTVDEYLERLRHLEQAPRLSDEQMVLARKFAYSLFTIRPFKFKSFTFHFKKIAEVKHPLFMNCQYHFKSWAEFANASDLKDFAEWAADRTRTDYLQDPIHEYSPH